MKPIRIAVLSLVCILSTWGLSLAAAQVKPGPTPYTTQEGNPSLCAPPGCGVPPEPLSCDIAEVLESGRRLVGSRTPPLKWPPPSPTPCFNEVCRAERRAAEASEVLGYEVRLKRFEEALHQCDGK